MSKNKTLIAMTAAGLLISSLSLAAENNFLLSCNGKTISLNQTQAEVIKSCGEPSITRNYKKSKSTILAYKFVDPNDSLIVTKAKFRFVNEKLKDISYDSENEKFDD
ncbi:DUF2845 domain-containing protein [Fastidiosibacter lacustris]|uniref:DUF2845 domain-containing protein n=1 Tax=Fastidiosibacter lacustris TaxID=2056695 RepID=UPI000E34CF03|nr:DUF2845 domain-containing protein [Fastidiosibacter lacustris]